MAGYNKDILKEYVPALVYTMYDGYYIYSPYINTLPEGEEYENRGGSEYPKGEKISGLKPYIHYSMRYVDTGIDVVITYSLDNYITIQGTINDKWINDSGYVIDKITDVVKDASGNPISVKYRGIIIEGETELQEYIGDNNNPNNLYKYVKVNGVKYYKDNDDSWFTIINGKKYGGQPKLKDGKNYSAVQYYVDAYEFGQRIESYGIKGLRTSAVKIGEEELKEEKFGNYTIFSGGSDSVEEPNSNFNQHRLAVIRYSIEKNLSTAIANYNNYVGQEKANFAMPELKEDEWDKILNNISIISFLQGLNIGGKVYNGYSIITNTKNKEVVAEDSIYITTSDGEYHNVKEIGLNEKSLETGVLNIDFERVSKLRDDGQIEYYYPRRHLGSYDSVVTQTNVTDTDNIYDYLEDKDELATVYYTALARERNSTYKASINIDNKMSNLTHAEINNTYNITINYLNEDGEKISSSSVINQKEGEYRITAPSEITPNYTFVSSDKDLSGTLNSDIEINLIYRRREVKYKITVNYLDENGIVFNSFVTEENQGYEYNIDIEDIIDNKYKFVEAEGNTSGILNSNIVINLRYETLKSKYKITINYLDENGNKLISSSFIEKESGYKYDIVAEDMLFREYKFIRAEGDAITGELNSDVEINFIYRKLTICYVTIDFIDSKTNKIIFTGQISGPEGTNYDLTESYYTESLYNEGYVYDETRGEPFINGVYSRGHKKIQAFCVKRIYKPDLERVNDNRNYTRGYYSVLSESPSKGGVDGNGNTLMSVSTTFRNNKNIYGKEQLIVATTENSGWAIRINENGRINFELHDGNSWRQECVGPQIQLNKIYNVIATYDGTGIRIYLNGRLVASMTLPGITITQLPDVRTLIGGNPQSNSTNVTEGFFYGNIYDVKVYYGYALNSEEIDTIFKEQQSKYRFY